MSDRACPKCNGILLKAPGETTRTCLQCGYEDDTVEVTADKSIKINSGKIQCSQCKKHFKSINGLRIHQAKKHSPHNTKSPITISNTTEEIKKPSKTYTCTLCGDIFTVQQGLAAHIAKHKRNPTDIMSILERTESQVKKVIMLSNGHDKEKYKEIRKLILEAIDILL